MRKKFQKDVDSHWLATVKYISNWEHTLMLKNN